MKQVSLPGTITYEVAMTKEMILAAKHLCHDVYLQSGYIDFSFPDRIIPYQYDASSLYIVALNSVNEVVGTVRLTIGYPFTTLNVWEDKLYPASQGLIDEALTANSFEIGALAVKKEYAAYKISWGLYKAVYLNALALNLDYGIISMDQRAMRAMEMLGWYVEKIGEPMDYFGSLTVPGIMPVRQQLAAIASRNNNYHQYLA